MIRRAIKDIKLDLLDLRRRQTRIDLSLTEGRAPHILELVARTHAYPAARPRVSIADGTLQLRGPRHGALDSVLTHRGRSIRDHHRGRRLERPTPGSRRSLDGRARGRSAPCFCVIRSTAASRTRATARWAWRAVSSVSCSTPTTRSTLTASRRLAEALDADPDAAFAYGTLECFRTGQPVGLMNTLPWDPPRLRMGNYIDAMAMIRTSLLREELRRLSARSALSRMGGLRPVVPHGRGRSPRCARARGTRTLSTSQHSMLAQTNISATGRLLADHREQSSADGGDAAARVSPAPTLRAQCSDQRGGRASRLMARSGAVIAS